MSWIRRFPLWQQIAVGMVLGILTGYVLGPTAGNLKWMGDLFLRLITMIVVPLIFLALVSGITSLEDSRDFKRIGLKGISAYMLTCFFAVILGMVCALVMDPGLGMTLTLPEKGAAIPAAAAGHGAPQSVSEFLLNLIPHNAIAAMADGHYLQVVVFAIFTGVTMNAIRERTEKLRSVVKEAAAVTFRMIEMIVRLAPIAVFAFMAWMVGTQGLESMIPLMKLVVTVLVACGLQYAILMGMILVFGRISPLPFMKKAVATQLMAFSTSSSKATLGTAMAELEEKMGVSQRSSHFMMPLGACINMDGTAIYLGITAIFFSQLFGIPLDWHDYGVLLLTATLGSIGAAGIPSGSIIFMGLVLGSVGLPLEGIGLILAVDRLLDMVRTTINITGDMAITLIIDRSEGHMDEQVYFQTDSGR